MVWKSFCTLSLLCLAQSFEQYLHPEPYREVPGLEDALRNLGMVVEKSSEHKHTFLAKNVVLVSSDADGISEVSETDDVPGYTKPFIGLKFPRELIKDVFSASEGELVCLKKGTPLRSIPYYFSAGSDRKWFQKSCLEVELGLVNFINRAQPLQLYWVAPSGRKHDQGKVEYGEPKTVWTKTSIGHRFVVEGVDELDGSAVSLSLTMECNTFRVIGSERQETQKHKREDISEADRARVQALETGRAKKISRTFTEHGYQRLHMPKTLWGSIQTFWNNNKVREDNMFEEVWRGRSIYVNWWHEVPLMSVAPFGLKAKWHALLQPVLEAWASTPLVPTDLYGIRAYFDGNWLLNHVDRHETHAVSAIINVEQTNMRADWELQVVDFNGTVVDSPLHEEEMFFYESAKVMHGRPKPLQGERYVNVFFHYRPAVAEGVKWWEESSDSLSRVVVSKDEL